MKKYIKLMRISQWVKNGFVFLPIIFSGNLLNIELLVLTLTVFFSFSFTASSIYILNDFMDIESDKNHPQKKFRPLASGEVSKKEATILFISLVAISAFMLITFGNLPTTLTISLYFLLNIGYSFGLKHIAIVDVSIISFGFLLRVFAGGFITDIPISDWTVLLTFTLALVMAFGKRRGELVNSQTKGKTRKSLSGYNLEFLNASLIISCIMTIICYVMFTLSPDTQTRIHHYIFYTFIFVIIGVLRYLQQTFVFNKTESPTKMIFTDLFLQITLLLWGTSLLLLIYFR